MPKHDDQILNVRSLVTGIPILENDLTPLVNKVVYEIYINKSDPCSDNALAHFQNKNKTVPTIKKNPNHFAIFIFKILSKKIKAFLTFQSARKALNLIGNYALTTNFLPILCLLA